MGGTFIAHDPEFAAVLSGTHLPTLEGQKAELAQHHEEVEISAGMTSIKKKSSVV